MSTWQQQERERRRVADEARALPREPLSRWVVVTLAVLLGLHLLSIAWQLAVLPDRVPQHWNGSTPDRWAGKPEAIAFSALFPLVGFALVPMSRLVLSFPDALNLPNKEWWLETPRRLRRLERLLREDLLLMAGWLIAVLIVADAHVVHASQQPGGVLDATPAMAAVGVLVALLLGYVGWMLLRRYRDDPTL